ncbi:MAG: hypothetical protein KAY24_17295 [Candidatus Eisenbacteria sp.]|nr:hypothetical protein [Candidatus Eisenbacteria bacterium]
MRRILYLAKRVPLIAAILLVVAILAGLALIAPCENTAGLAQPAWAGLGDPPAGQIVLTYGVGGILTTDGTLWQYRPDLNKWLTIDAAFRQEGRTTSHVLPLPVPADQIQQMATWGFIVTTSGDVWLYEMATDKWKRLPPPPAGR